MWRYSLGWSAGEPGHPSAFMMTHPLLTPQVKSALDDICSRPVLLHGEMKRIAFLHNASFNAVRSLLPVYRDNRGTPDKSCPTPAEQGKDPTWKRSKK